MSPKGQDRRPCRLAMDRRSLPDVHVGQGRADCTYLDQCGLGVVTLWSGSGRLGGGCRVALPLSRAIAALQPTPIRARICAQAEATHGSRRKGPSVKTAASRYGGSHSFCAVIGPCPTIARQTDPCCGQVPRDRQDDRDRADLPHKLQQKGPDMNQIIYIVGLIVIVVVILGFFGLR